MSASRRTVNETYFPAIPSTIYGTNESTRFNTNDKSFHFTINQAIEMSNWFADCSSHSSTNYPTF
jgi:hypothetical protein